jgi:hypothetical protein
MLILSHVQNIPFLVCDHVISGILLFPEKEAKSVSSASQKITYSQLILREAEPRGFGGWPPKKTINVFKESYFVDIFFFFQKKKQKA